jgi:hypothetical protein
MAAGMPKEELRATLKRFIIDVGVSRTDEFRNCVLTQIAYKPLSRAATNWRSTVLA